MAVYVTVMSPLRGRARGGRQAAGLSGGQRGQQGSAWVTEVSWRVPVVTQERSAPSGWRRDETVADGWSSLWGAGTGRLSIRGGIPSEPCSEPRQGAVRLCICVSRISSFLATLTVT